ncbi:MAG TPA: hypothetical protein VG501_03800 [Rhizomicrobium sp.]|nr:hypothetical protein [Rhizomicrobium sp.]
MLLQRGFRIAQYALSACCGFYLLVLFIDYLQAGDPAAMVWGAGVAVTGIAVTGLPCAALWLAAMMRRRRSC